MKLSVLDIRLLMLAFQYSSEGSRIPKSLILFYFSALHRRD